MSSLSSSSSSKNHSKKSNSSRDRDKNKSINEVGGSSHSEVPPVAEKDGSQSQGKFAGIGPESVLCMAEQIGVELTAEAATNLAEDVSYKLRQTISAIALHSEMMKKTCVDSWDVNTVFELSDTSQSVGTCAPHYAYISSGEDRICCEIESTVDITEYALTPQTYVYGSLPSITVEWITEENSLSPTGHISSSLYNYYTKVARAILNLKKKPMEIAVQDLTTNTRIGPIFPNLFNLAVLVLNEDNLNALNVPAKKPLQSNVLQMVDALCANPCSNDTNIQQQFQRLFPVMVSNILGNGILSDKLVAMLTKITRTWPSFITIGKGILFEYLSQGTKERLTGPLIRCLMALGRRTMVECLGDHLNHIDDCLHLRHVKGLVLPDIRDAILDVTTYLMRSEPTTYLEDYVKTDYTLYEMLGDSILPRRTIFLVKNTRRRRKGKKKKVEAEPTIIPIRPVIRRPKVRILQTARSAKKIIPREAVFKTVKRASNIRIKIKNCRSLEPRKVNRIQQNYSTTTRPSSEVVVASGFLNRFRYKLKRNRNRKYQFPLYGALML